MTVEELKEDIELVAVELIEKFDIKFSIEEGILPVQRNSKFISKWHYSRNYYSYIGYEYDYVKTYYFGFKIFFEYDLSISPKVFKEYVEEISKKICIQTGYKLSSIEINSEDKYEPDYDNYIYIYELPLKYTLVDPINPNLQSVRNK